MSGVSITGPRFGTAGLSESFKAQGYKGLAQVPPYIASFGLNAFEVQFGRGVRMADAVADSLRQESADKGIQLSVHAPYYISMSSMEEEKRLGSLRYILQSAVAVRRLGGKRVIFHSGSAGKQSREAAMEKASDTLAKARKMLDDEGFEDILLCPETMGKVGQLGTLSEVLALCKGDARHIPCIDFGHLNARTQGAIKTKQDYADILDEIAAELGEDRARCFHVHFSKIEYSAGGEKRHLTFADTQYGPCFEPFVELCAQRALAPVIICESDGTQAEDAQSMMKYYKTYKIGLDI